MQYVILLAALAIASASAAPENPLDIQNAYVTNAKEFTYKSVDTGDAQSHYKTWELLVGRLPLLYCAC